MPFGKRKTPPPGKPADRDGLSQPQPARPQASQSRLTLLRDAMDRCLTQAAELAALVQRMDMLDASRFGPQWRRDQYPIAITDLGELFALGAGTPAQRSHALYAYSYPPHEEDPDRSAQGHLHDLTSAIVRINAMCFEGHRDGALGVVLQSPAMHAQIDGAIVRAAFFSAFFENMLAEPAPADAALNAGAADFERLHGVLARRLTVARDAMLAASRLEALVPNRRWPFIGVELGYGPHVGERTIDEVYFPKDLAEALMRTAHAHVADPSM
jgi:hypothetical protein